VKCPSCNNENPAGTNFCQSCGNSLTANAAPAQGQPMQPMQGSPMIYAGGWGRPATPDETKSIMSTVKWTVIIATVVPVLATVGILWYVFTQI
jgi:Double zinc ribbon